MNNLNVVLIEDEPVTARNLAHLLQIIVDSLNVIATLPGVEESVDWFKTNTGKYDLVFMDIKLADGLSFDIFKQVNIQTPVIFVTAYNDYGITAFKNNGIDYILKPFDREELEQALTKFRKFTSHSETSIYSNQLSQLMAQISGGSRLYKKSFLVHFRDKLIPIEAAAISFFTRLMRSCTLI